MGSDVALQIAGTVFPLVFALVAMGWKLAGLITGLGTKVDGLAERVTKLEEHTYYSPRRRRR